jgi:sugar phosphate permease
MTAGGLAGLLATLPAGFITDTSRNKRAVLALVCLLITLSTLLLWFSQQSALSPFRKSSPVSVRRLSGR